ncbi:MAG: DNA polymerase I [Acidobacteriota bacterium]
MYQKILVIDAMYLIFSSYYINRNLRTLKGEPSGALFGFVSRIENLISEVKPDKLVVAFDSKGKTFRNDIYPEYKANRDDPPEDLVTQIPYVKEFLDKREIGYIEAPGFEADDIIAGIAYKAEKNEKIIIFSADKDLFQLVNGNVSIWHPKLKKELDRDGVKDFFGLYPDQVVDYLTMTGDSSDNIPGVPGIGDKGAKKILEESGSLDDVLADPDILEEKYKKKILAGMDSLNLSRTLVDLSKVKGLEVKEENWSFPAVPGRKLIEFYKRFGFNSIIKRLNLPETFEKPSLDIEYNLVFKKEELDILKNRILNEKYFAFDLETTGLEFFSSDIVGLSISFSDSGYYIPFLFPENELKKPEFTFEDFRKMFSEIFKDKDIKKTGHNLKFDTLHMMNSGIQVKGISDDTMIISYLLYPNRRAHKLKELSTEFLDYDQTEFDELTGRGKGKKNIAEIGIEKTGNYCIDDSVVTLMLKEKLEKKISEKGLDPLYRDVEIPLSKVLTAIEFNGVKLDLDYLRVSSEYLSGEIEALEKELHKAAGYDINLNSSQQLGVFLFEKMGLPAAKKTRKTGAYSTDIEVLHELRGYPIVKSLIDYRSLTKLNSTFVEGLLDTIDDSDRVHTSYNQTVAATGRLSSSNPNLQNIPVGETGGVSVRRGFIAEKGNILLAADYSQVELRVMAHFSEDENLMDAFRNDFDIHQYTADRVFGKDLFLTDHERRKRAKIINFSVLYGSGPFSLSRELGVTYGEAKDFIEMYFEKYIGVRKFIDDVISDCEEELLVKTILGRIRPIPEIKSENKNVRDNGRRMAINTVIQGSAADIIKVAMINIDKKIENMKSRMVMQVHDELIFELPPDEEKSLRTLVRNEMENSVKLKVPLTVTIKTGKNWEEME